MVMVEKKKNDRWLDCPWCGQVTRITRKGNKEFCKACEREVKENGMRNNIGSARDRKDTDKF